MSDRPLRVFVPSVNTRYDMATGQNVPTVDINSAAAFGELYLMSSVEDDSDRLKQVRESAQEIGPRDYILVIGDLALVTIAAALALTRNGRVRLVRWNHSTKDYNVTEVT